MSLTITEKQHWKERIEARIEAEIKRLKADDREFFQQVSVEAKDAAVQKLGIATASAKLKKLAERIQNLRDEHESLQNETARKLNIGYFYNGSCAIQSAINEMVPVEEERLMKEHPLGKRVVALGEEKESLLDTVWLATSSPQIRELWQQVDRILGVSSTGLQAEIFRKKKKS